MKLDKSNIFFYIWLIHLLVYYTTYTITIRILTNNFNQFYIVFWGFTGSFIGLYERIPFFFLIPLIFMFILIYKKINTNRFSTYIISIYSAYIINYIWLFFTGKHVMTIDDQPINLIYFIIPSLLTSTLLNWLIFKNKYKESEV